jgi:hypothetical protein
VGRMQVSGRHNCKCLAVSWAEVAPTALKPVAFSVTESLHDAILG